MRPGDAETIDVAAWRRAGGADVVATDALGRQFVFRIVVSGNAELTQKVWESFMTLLAGLIGAVAGHFLGGGSKRQNQLKRLEANQSPV